VLSNVNDPRPRRVAYKGSRRFSERLPFRGRGSPLRAGLALVLMLLTACDTPTLATPTPLALTSQPTSAAPAPAAIVTAFVDAINAQDFAAAYGLLDIPSQARLGNPSAVKQSYEDTRAVATAISTTLRISGLIEQNAEATASLFTTWHSELFGTFESTSTLRLIQDNAAQTWQVAWNRDVILTGLDTGRLFIRRGVAQARSAIYFADGSVAAEPSEITTLGVQRGNIASDADEQAMLAVLSQISGQPAEQIKSKYQNQPADWFVPVATITDDQFISETERLQPFKAIIAQRSYTRLYSQTDLAPHIVGWVGSISAEGLDDYKLRGYTGDEQVGIAGVEAQEEDTLGGRPQVDLQLISDVDGSVRVVARQEFVRPQDVTLTLQPALQRQVQQLLGRRVGAAIIVNVRDGGVLAMATSPTFDAAAFTDQSRNDERVNLLDDPEKPLLNRAVQTNYPPGSAFKMVTMAAGIREGAAQPEEIFVDRGVWDELGQDFQKTCWLRSGHGRITLQDGLSASCNVVFYSVGKRLDELGQSLLPDYARAFGFGQRTGIEISGEAAGVVPGPEWKQQNIGDVWTTGDAVNMAIGQGYILVTPLQIAQMTQAIANNGTLIHPHIISKIGETTQPISTTALPLDAATLQAIQTGMIGVTQNARVGTAHFRFDTFDYYFNAANQIVAGNTLSRAQRANARKLVVAGKSGTAQVSGEAKPDAWFTAYVPADDPQIAVTVLLENAGEGSVVAAPVARQIIEAYFGLPISATPTDSRVSD